MGLWDHMKPAEKMAAPTAIERTADGLKLDWGDGTAASVSTRGLRLGCPCAGCVEEWSGKRIVEPSQIAPDVKIDKLDPVGNYAISITFSDGHSTGIYSWKTLKALCVRVPGA